MGVTLPFGIPVMNLIDLQAAYGLKVAVFIMLDISFFYRVIDYSGGEKSEEEQ
jgi:hypothetical protein